jgi:hypothetical protein
MARLRLPPGIIIYRAALLAIARPRMEQLAFRELPSATPDTSEDLAIPLTAAMQIDAEVRERLDRFDCACRLKAEVG